MITGEEIPFIFQCSCAVAMLYSQVIQFGWAQRIPFQQFCSPAFDPSFTEARGTPSLTMSTEAKWSDKLLELCGAGLLAR